MFLMVAVLGLVVGGCGSTKTVVSKSVDLSKYRYVSVVDDSHGYMPTELVPYEIQIFDAVAASGLDLINADKVMYMPRSEQEQLLMAKYAVENSPNESSLVVNFVDYNTGRPLVSVRGADSKTLGVKASLEGAIKRVHNQVAKAFEKK